MNWEWPYIIALVGAFIPGILGILSWINERKKGNLDLLSMSHSSAIQLLQIAQARVKEVEEELGKLDAQYDLEKASRRKYEDSVFEAQCIAREYERKIKESEEFIDDLEKLIAELKERLAILEVKNVELQALVDKLEKRVKALRKRLLIMEAKDTGSS